MKTHMRITALMLALLMSTCSFALAQSTADATTIVLSDEGITVDGQAVSTDEDDAVYAANDIVFYLAGQGYTYGEGTEQDEHTQQEADAHTVLHITKPGTYVLSGSLSAGQVAVDLGKKADDDPTAVVTLVLNGVDVTCTVAPAVIFYNVYECSSSDEDDATMYVDTKAAGANVLIADGSVNNISGSYVARIYKSYTLSEDGTEVIDSKKLHKYDAAFYSKMSMNIGGGPLGSGVLNINAQNEGLGSELHLTINGGTINIVSGNDGINTNEDNVSVTAVNGGSLNIVVNGGTGEGDGIDSNGWLVINGGTVTTAACGFSSDAGIDSDCGIYLNGGTVKASGNMLDHISGGSADYMVMNFADFRRGGETVAMKDEEGNTVAEWTPANDYTYLIVTGDAVVPGNYTLWSGEQQLAYHGVGTGGMMPPGGMPRPEGKERPEMLDAAQFPEGLEPPERPEDMEFPEGMKPPEMPEGMERPQGGFDGHHARRDRWDATGEPSVEFVLEEGGNSFFGIAAYQPTVK